MEYSVILLLIGLIIFLVIKIRKISSIKKTVTIAAKANIAPVEKDEAKLHYTIQSFTDPGKNYSADLKEMTCTCADFYGNRNSYSLDDPRRLCKHLVRALSLSPTFTIEFRPFEKYLKILQRYNKSFKPMAHKSSTEIGSQRITVFSDTFDDKISEYGTIVFVSGELHRYNPVINQWFYGEEPKSGNKEEIERWLELTLNSFQPDSLAGNIFKTVYRRQAKNTYNVKGQMITGTVAWIYMSSDYSVINGTVGDCHFHYDVGLKELQMDKRIKYLESGLLEWIKDEVRRMNL